jgi:hypothetical protein
MHGVCGAQKNFGRQIIIALLRQSQNRRSKRQPFPKALVQIGRELPQDHAVLACVEPLLPQMTVENCREFHLSDFAAGDAPGFTRILPNLVAARFAQVALGQIRCVVIGQRLSSSSSRAESTDNSGRRSNPRTSLRSAKSTPAPSSAGKRRAAGRPRSRTSRPRFPRAAARTHWPVFMCKSRIVIVVICAQCVTKDRLSTPPPEDGDVLEFRFNV